MLFLLNRAFIASYADLMKTTTVMSGSFKRSGSNMRTKASGEVSGEEVFSDYPLTLKYCFRQSTDWIHGAEQ